ncbi:hypothetical protein DDE18_09000 [Nocardioides gansuensis]|uniref:Sulfatase N-terminal domain-containing protein n=1 Tax=Nocardioides gansuensis TaxID=2138300 RepID=A0A2T8FCI9_9ACTN|nr:sulfatase-like hydrolase/transferase [Nocardioides gansuensis]PVG83415.1 hypothetical protein DDE18_09000 [Nocardioides gansuensis]
MRTVQRGRGRLLTGLAVLVVLVVLTLPPDLRDVGPWTFLRLPLEAVLLLGVLVAIPPGRREVRRVVALAAGTVLGVMAVFRLLDVGFLRALNRPFDPLIDWRYAGSLADLVRNSFGDALGAALLVAAATAAVTLLVLMPLAVLRVTRMAAAHRRTTGRAAVALAVGWTVAAVTTGIGVGALASRDAAGYVYAQVARIPAQLRDQREFAAAAEHDPFDRVDAEDLLAGLRGKDVLVVFVESLGRVALEDPAVSPDVVEVLDSGTRRLARAGFASRSAWLTSPTFGGISWLAHATLQSGLWVDSQRRYDVLVTSPRLTLSRLFARAGWRTVADVPANDRAWPQGEFYGFDRVYDSRHVGYRGPPFGYATMPDQFTLEAFHRLELARRARRPVMAEIDLVSSHAPWAPTPRMVDWSALGDGSLYDGMDAEVPSEDDVWPSPERVRQAYAESVAYSLTALVEFVVRHGDEDLVVVFLGDHQPATIVSGEDAGPDVPIALVAHDAGVLDRVAGWGWDDGLRPGAGAPVWRMDLFRDRFLAAYGRSRHSGAQAGAAR